MRNMLWQTSSTVDRPPAVCGSRGMQTVPLRADSRIRGSTHPPACQPNLLHPKPAHNSELFVNACAEPGPSNHHLCPLPHTATSVRKYLSAPVRRNPLMDAHKLRVERLSSTRHKMLGSGALTINVSSGRRCGRFHPSILPRANSTLGVWRVKAAGGGAPIAGQLVGELVVSLVGVVGPPARRPAGPTARSPTPARRPVRLWR